MKEGPNFARKIHAEMEERVKRIQLVLARVDFQEGFARLEICAVSNLVLMEERVSP